MNMNAVDAGDWIAVAAVIVAVLTGVIAVISAQAGKEAAAAAQTSAEEARTISGLERERRADEVEARHDDRKPARPLTLEKMVTDPPNRSLATHIVLHRAYRVQAVAIDFQGARRPLALPLLVEPNTAYQLHIEPWPAGQTTPKTREIHFRFWPPTEDDATDPWTCRCGRSSGESPDGPGHWEWREPVRYHG